ncbi:MAG TPA: GNAT family N-acetyltransferase [Methylomirabilota bacterium]|nr:GNAT family N-acetyltransferase [Methylomirabilota bacterium]
MAEVRIERITLDDVPRVVTAHIDAFPGFFLTTLGPGFLRAFYRAFTDEPTAISLKASSPEHPLLGFVVGTVEPDGFFKRLLKRRWWEFGTHAAMASLKNPAYTSRLLRAVAYRGGPDRPEGFALLSSIAVLPAAQGKGVGKALVSEWKRLAVENGSPGYYLTTDAVGNDPVNHFYQSLGLKLTSSYTTKEGRVMNLYSQKLSQ